MIDAHLVFDKLLHSSNQQMVATLQQALWYFWGHNSEWAGSSASATHTLEAGGPQIHNFKTLEKKKQLLIEDCIYIYIFFLYMIYDVPLKLLCKFYSIYSWVMVNTHQLSNLSNFMISVELEPHGLTSFTIGIGLSKILMQRVNVTMCF